MRWRPAIWWTGPADPTKLASWLEIREDNTVLVRTGRTEIGVGMSGYYAQTVAEELRVQPDAISLVMGDTDKTPDGGYSAGLLDGAKNLRKVSAYTYQALLTLASTQLGVPATGLSVTDGVVSGGGKQVSYGQLVRGQHLQLTIPVKGEPAKVDPKNWAGIAGLDGFEVTGDPPLKKISEYTVIGEVVPDAGHPRQDHRQDAVELRSHAARHAPRAHGAADVARIDAGERRHARQTQVPPRAGRAQSKSAGGGLAERMGSGERGPRSRPARNGRLVRPARQ